MKRRYVVGISAVLLTGSVMGGWYTVSAQRPPDKRLAPGVATPSRSKDEIDQIRERSRSEQGPFLDSFRSRGQSIPNLPRVNLPYNGDIYYTNLGDLVRNVAVIAIGTVKQVNFEADGSGVRSLPSTISTFEVERYLKRPARDYGQQLRIVQFGGPFKQPSGEVVLAQLAGDPIFVPGERYILFLRDRQDGLFEVAGSRARYQVDNGRIRILTPLQDEATWAKRDGQTEQSLLDEISASLP